MKAKAHKNSPLEKITEIFLIFLGPVFLLFTSAYQTITETKHILFLIICGGYVTVMLITAFETLIIGARKPVKFREAVKKISWPQKLMTLYLFFTWISAFSSPYFPQTIQGMSRYEGALSISLYCICFLLVSVFGKADRKLLIAFSASVLIFSILCIEQLFGQNPFGLYPAGYNYFGANVDYPGAYIGTIGNVDLVSAFLCIAIPIFWAALIRIKNGKKWLLLIPLASAAFVLIKIWVMAGLVGVAGSLLVSLPVIAKKPAVRKWLTVVVIVLIIAALALIWSFDIGTGMLHEAHELLHGNANESFGSGRLYIWSQVLKEVPKHLLLGTGSDTMMEADLEAFSRYDETLGGTIVAQIDVAHNEYLNVLFHQGIFALLSYLAALCCIFVKWVKSANRNSSAAILGSAVLGYCIQAFFGFSMCITAPFFWITLALLESSINKQEEKAK